MHMCAYGCTMKRYQVLVHSFVRNQLERRWGQFLEFFYVLDPEKFLFGGPRTEKKFRENDYKRSSEIQKFSKENVDICLVVREPRQNLSSGPRVVKG